MFLNIFSFSCSMSEILIPSFCRPNSRFTVHISCGGNIGSDL
jgi:hypothetical protein